jgi:hypothetical protein
LRSYLKEKVLVLVKKVKNTAVGICHADHVAPSIHNGVFFYFNGISNKKARQYLNL